MEEKWKHENEAFDAQSASQAFSQLCPQLQSPQKWQQLCAKRPHFSTI
jgi:hypothetical protein